MNINKGHCIPGRLFDCQSRSDKASKRCCQDGTIPPKIGMDNQYEQISTRAISTYRILRDRMGHLKQHKSPPGKEILLEKGFQQTSIKSKMELAIRKEPAKKAEFCVFCNTTWKTSLQKDTKSSQYFTRGVNPQKGSHSCKGTRRMQMVDSKSRKEKSPFQINRDNIHHIRCLRPRMPGNHKRKSTRKSWSQEDMNEAIKAVKENKMGWLLASKHFNVPKATRRRHYYRTPVNLGRFKPTFNAEMEKALIDHMLEFESRLFGFNTTEIRKLAFEFAEKLGLDHRFDKNKKE
ncbi:uncharacterized protein LOC111354574 [Spodoptera litura]|uniref:Uncharacterized protein LOC111354574 n=1 Tax=Spodoptera litura TaxID=69820 RepID=A0A9J7IUM9_SPOLT|nr:uncharacterized protein LOC111354574 [Spodoptera litura]